MTYVIEHTSKHLPELPPRYWTGDDDEGRWSLTADIGQAATFPTADDAEEAFRGSHRDAGSCCLPRNISEPTVQARDS